MGLAKQNSEFEKNLVNVGVDLIKQERAGVVKWSAVRFYSVRAQRLIDEYEAKIGQGIDKPVLEVDQDIQVMVEEYQMGQIEKEARELLESVRIKIQTLSDIMH